LISTLRSKSRFSEDKFPFLRSAVVLFLFVKKTFSQRNIIHCDAKHNVYFACCVITLSFYPNTLRFYLFSDISGNPCNIRAFSILLVCFQAYKYLLIILLWKFNTFTKTCIRIFN